MESVLVVAAVLLVSFSGFVLGVVLIGTLLAKEFEKARKMYDEASEMFRKASDANLRAEARLKEILDGR